jgi:hypothetical protein
LLQGLQKIFGGPLAARGPQFGHVCSIIYHHKLRLIRHLWARQLGFQGWLYLIDNWLGFVLSLLSVALDKDCFFCFFFYMMIIASKQPWHGIWSKLVIFSNENNLTNSWAKVFYEHSILVLRHTFATFTAMLLYSGNFRYNYHNYCHYISLVSFMFHYFN